MKFQYKTVKLFYLFSVVFLLTYGSTIGQTDHGKILLGNNSSFSYTSLKYQDATEYYDLGTSSTKSLSFTPELGIFIVNNFALGIAARYESDETKKDNGTYKSNSYYAIPFFQLYIGKGPVKFYSYAGIGFGKSDYSEYGYGTSFSDKTKNLTLYEVGGGIAAFINKNVSLEFGLAYSSGTSKYEDRKDKVKGFGIQIGIVLCL